MFILFHLLIFLLEKKSYHLNYVLIKIFTKNILSWKVKNVIYYYSYFNIRKKKIQKLKKKEKYKALNKTKKEK